MKKRPVRSCPAATTHRPHTSKAPRAAIPLTSAILMLRQAEDLVDCQRPAEFHTDYQSLVDGRPPPADRRRPVVHLRTTRRRKDQVKLLSDLDGFLEPDTGTGLGHLEQANAQVQAGSIPSPPDIGPRPPAGQPTSLRPLLRNLLGKRNGIRAARLVRDCPFATRRGASDMTSSTRITSQVGGCGAVSGRRGNGGHGTCPE